MWLSMNLKLLHHTLTWQCHWGKGLCDRSMRVDDCTNNRMLFKGASLGHWMFPVKAQLMQCGVAMSHSVCCKWWNPAVSVKERQTCFSRQWRTTRLLGQVQISSPLPGGSLKVMNKWTSSMDFFFFQKRLSNIF